MEDCTNRPSKMKCVFNGPSGFDVGILAQHVFGASHEVPEVEEGWIGVGRAVQLGWAVIELVCVRWVMEMGIELT